MDLAEYRKSSYEIWQAMAAGWERHRQWVWDASRPVSEWMVATLDPQPGQTILELAAGTGETGFAAASRLGDSGHLISTDFSPQMIEAAERRVRELGLSNVDVRVMDAERMDLEDDSVDGVLCRFGYMLMADAAQALSETRRVLRDGGRLSFAVWGSMEQNPWAALGGAPLVARGHMPMPQPDDPGIFSMGSEERVRELVNGAGFAGVEIEAIPVEWSFEDFEGYWRFLRELAGGIAMVLDRLSEDDRRAIHDDIEQNATAFRANGAYTMPGVALAAVAS